MLGIAPSERPEQWPTRSKRDWQIFGKMDFYDNSPEEGKALITAYLLVIWMVGLGGLEPPTSPLSGGFMVSLNRYTLSADGDDYRYGHYKRQSWEEQRRSRFRFHRLVLGC